MGNTIAIGFAQRPVTIRASIDISVTGDRFLDMISQTTKQQPFFNTFDNSVDLEVTLSSLSAVLDLAIYMDWSEVRWLRTDQILNLNCWLSTLRPIDGFYMAHAALSLGGFGFNVRCRHCSSEGFRKKGPLTGLIYRAPHHHHHDASIAPRRSHASPTPLLAATCTSPTSRPCPPLPAHVSQASLSSSLRHPTVSARSRKAYRWSVAAPAPSHAVLSYT